MNRSSSTAPATRIWQHCFYPLFMLSGIALCLVLLHATPKSYWPLIPVAMTGLMLPLVLLAEKRLPYRKDWQGAQEDSRTDVIRTFVVFPLASLLALYLLQGIKRFYPFHGLFENPTNNPGLQVAENIVFFLVSDFFYYWAHRAFHSSRFLWPFHAIHHGATRVYAVNSGKFHFFDAFCASIAYFTPMFVLGASGQAIVLVMTLSILSGFLEHANINFKAGVLNYIFNTAELHRWHHSTRMDESNSNFGKVLSLWDVCFGTFWFPKEKEVQEVGIKDEAVPHSFRKQLSYPFKRRRR